MRCWFGDCPNKPIICLRNLHLVGYQDTYSETNHDVLEIRKPVWAPCGKWVFACNLHNEPIYYDIGELCPHGSTPKERGVPVPNMPLIGKTAIVLETEI